MAKYNRAEQILQARHVLLMETLFYVEKKGWVMTYVLPNVGPTLYVKMLDGKRVTMTVDHAFDYEVAVEEEYRDSEAHKV